jgi:hypothetical protein
MKRQEVRTPGQVSSKSIKPYDSEIIVALRTSFLTVIYTCFLSIMEASY